MNRTNFTRYASASNNDLLLMFSTSNWSNLSFEERMDACQEVENRYAAANGVTACVLKSEPMIGGCYGYQSNGSITLNENLVQNGKFVTRDWDDAGNEFIREIQAPAPNWGILDTVFHEGTHGIQESQGRLSDAYISPEQNYDIYRIQACEKEAFAAGQYNTLQTIDTVQKETGTIDPNASAYYATIKEEAYQPSLDNAIKAYNDPQIENTLAQVINDRDNGLTPENPSESYTALNELCDGITVAVTQEASNVVAETDSSSIHGEQFITDNDYVGDLGGTIGNSYDDCGYDSVETYGKLDVLDTSVDLGCRNADYLGFDDRNERECATESESSVENILSDNSMSNE